VCGVRVWCACVVWCLWCVCVCGVCVWCVWCVCVCGVCVCGALVRSKLKPDVAIQLRNVMSRANSYRMMRSLTLCSLIATFCFCRMCAKNGSQQFILILLSQGFNSSVFYVPIFMSVI